MRVLATETWRRDYLALNAASKMRVRVALGKFEAEDPSARVHPVDPLQAVSAIMIDDFLCVTFRPADAPDTVYLLNVRSIDAAGTPGAST